jgi:hypothetical protein
MDSLTKHRSKLADRGERYLQIVLDPETMLKLEALKGELRLRRRTSEIIRRALMLLYEKTFGR